MNFRRPRSRSCRNSMNFMVSTEKWRSYNKRISRRNADFIDEDFEEDEPKIDDLKNWVEDFFIQKSLGSSKSDQDIEMFLTRKQTLILATLVPDEILLMQKYDTTNPKRFVGVLLMADVSGYTALTERYNNLGKSGTYRLTVTLNTYLGSLIELIYSHGGDIIKFAGDAFLALWKTDKRTFLSHTIHTAIACALIIQHSYGSYESDVKVNLKVKLAISAGNLVFAPIGTGVDMNYIIVGLPVIEAKVAESVCSSGEVTLTPTAWAHCYSRNYDHLVHDNGHVTIKSILYDPHDKDVTKPFAGFGPLVRQIKKPFIAIENLPDNLIDSSNSTNNANLLRRNEMLSLRKTILLADEKNIGSEIRKFMIRPVLTQIDAHQPLEYLTEMRQVTILFITLKPRECPLPQLITIVNNAYQITCEIVYKSMGCVNKIILFDKDVMILVIFGLRGFKHESEAHAALKCGYSIKRSVSALDGVSEVSIGITTGQVYCGVVGHPLRREFTVIGAIVNKAARFMCGFRNKITCDEATFVKSKMSTNGFTIQPPTALKGIPQPGKIYEYTEEIRVKELYDIPVIAPLLNRSDEMEYLENWIDERNLSYRDFDALLIIGESRIGKTKLLEWMARCVKNKDLHICYVSLTSIHSATPYLALSQIINQILDLKEPITGFTKEEKIVQLLKSYNDDLCYLNNIIKVRFAYHEGVYSQDDQIRKEKEKDMFTKLIMSITDTHVIFLDDLQNLDGFSWEFISIILKSINIFTVLTVTRGKFRNVNNWIYKVFMNKDIRKIALGPLSSLWITPLACQILNVCGVSNDLCTALQTRCNSMPGLIETFILHLFSIGALEVKNIDKEECADWKKENVQFPDSVFLHPIAINSKDQATLDKLIQENNTGEMAICIVTKKEELNTDLNLQSLDALVMIQIDSLTPYQQLLLKIASVIGNVLSRDLLESIMYENNPLTTAKAVKRLFSMHILSCANVKYYNNRKRMTSTLTQAPPNSSYSNIICECCFDYDPESNNDLPKYAFCKVMRFKNKNSRKTCYELLPVNQKREFHSRIVHYLEKNKQKCNACGGTIMIVQSIISLQTDIPFSRKINNNQDINNNTKINEYEMETTNKIQSNTESLDIRKAKSESWNKESSFDEVLKITSEVLVNRNSFINLSSNQSSVQCIPILKKSSDNDATRRSVKRVTMSSLLFKDISSQDLKRYKIYEMLREVTEANKISDWHQLGVIDSLDEINNSKYSNTRESFSIKIEKGVSRINMNRCTCAELNIVIYEQLSRHAKEAELKSKAVEFLIKFSFHNVLANNFGSALPTLEEAENMCMLTQTDEINKLEKTIFLGRIYSLKAASYLMSENLQAAKLNIEHALHIYRINLDKVQDLFKLSGITWRISISRKIYRKFVATLKSDSIFCLNVAAPLYSTLGEEGKSRAATLRALHLAKTTNCKVIDSCDAITNAIQMEIERGSLESAMDIERLAIIFLAKLPQAVQADELFALGKLCMAIFRVRIARGELAATIRSGYRALVISRFLQADSISIDIIPDLFYVLLSRCRLQEAVDLVKLCLQLGQNQSTVEYETWYYALCMDMILDGGFELEPPDEINRFAEYALHSGKSTGPGRRRLVVSLWTYWLRIDSDFKAKRFESEALRWNARKNDDVTFNTLLSATRLAEGMLESLARKVDDLKKVVDLMELRSLADKELTRIEKDVRVFRALFPRWLLLKANSLRLSGRQSLSTSTFNQAIEESRKMHNRLEEATVQAEGSNSGLWIESARTGRFLHWSIAVERIPTSWHKLLYKKTAPRS